MVIYSYSMLFSYDYYGYLWLFYAIFMVIMFIYGYLWLFYVVFMVIIAISIDIRVLMVEAAHLPWMMAVWPFSWSVHGLYNHGSCKGLQGVIGGYRGL